MHSKKALVVVLAMVTCHVMCAPRLQMPMMMMSLRTSGILQDIRDKTLTSTLQLAKMEANGVTNMKIVDVSKATDENGDASDSEFRSKHIPGARFLNLLSCTGDSSVYEAPSAERFAQCVGDLGVSNRDHVVVYGKQVKLAARLWWYFRRYGHYRVSVLDGGLSKWEADGYPTASGPPDIVKAEKFTSRPRDHLLAKFEDVERNLETRRYQVVDTRKEKQFKGLETKPINNNRPGRIPNSINLPSTLLTNTDGVFKATAEICQMFTTRGVDLYKPIITTCNTGNTATVVALAAHLCGNEAAVYDGSYTEYYCQAAADQLVLGPGEIYTPCLIE